MDPLLQHTPEAEAVRHGMRACASLTECVYTTVQKQTQGQMVVTGPGHFQDVHRVAQLEPRLLISTQHHALIHATTTDFIMNKVTLYLHGLTERLVDCLHQWFGDKSASWPVVWWNPKQPSGALGIGDGPAHFPGTNPTVWDGAIYFTRPKEFCTHGVVVNAHDVMTLDHVRIIGVAVLKRWAPTVKFIDCAVEMALHTALGNQGSVGDTAISIVRDGTKRKRTEP